MPVCLSLGRHRPSVQVPLVLPTSLAPTLEGLHVMARGFNEDTRWLQHWGWLQSFSRLNSMRLQVSGGLGGMGWPASMASCASCGALVPCLPLPAVQHRAFRS